MDAALGAADQLLGLAADLPFSALGNKELLEIKLMLVLGSFVFARRLAANGGGLATCTREQLFDDLAARSSAGGRDGKPYHARSNARLLSSLRQFYRDLQRNGTLAVDPTLLVAANTSGGVVGKMISPQNLTIAATAVGLIGRESDILRKVVGWSIGMLIALCLLVGLQSTVLSFLLP